MRLKAPDLATAQRARCVAVVQFAADARDAEHVRPVLGGLPIDACQPEIWLDDERDEALARRLIEAASAGPAAGAAPWRCARCGETLDAQFTACWHCGASRDPRDG